ncbi:jerky protein homolog-like [Leptopilina heterotoma]|uniref:jerky protein homolog-like n=1 Tax=Leptopilina heterotoma TaxID=63436 RepID=UPI001CA8F7C7|nr:jerky protein homolog-like [Leptopilina heterotoma]
MDSSSSPSTSKRKRTVLSVEKKLEILSKLEKGETGVCLARFYNVGTATITDIKKNRESLMIFASQMDTEEGPKRRKTMKMSQNETLDDALSKWFIQRRSLGQPISGPLLCEKALDFNEKLGGSSNFKASTGWLEKFKNRHGIRQLQIQGEALSANSDAAEKFKLTIGNYIEEGGYSRDDIYNADESGLNWRSLPRKSLASRQETSACGFKVSKDRVTIMTCANASGTHKLPLLVIGKAKNPRCFKNIKNLPVSYKSQKSAWMDLKLFCDWFKNDFIKSVKKWRKDKGKDGKVLLLLDNAPSHPSVDVLNSFDPNFVVMFLPPNVTALIQPMDQGVIEKLKRLYRKNMLKSLLLLDDNSEINVASFPKTLNLKHCCFMVADAWELLTEENLKRAWNKLLSLETDSEETIEAQNISEFNEFFSNIPGFADCDADDAIDWINSDANDPGYQLLNDEEIISSVTNLTENDDENESEDECLDETKKVSNSEAFNAFEIGLEWYAQQEECSCTQLLLLRRMRNLAAKKRIDAIFQSKITKFMPKKS